MALGTDGLITVVGDFDALDGSPVSGKVTVTPSVQIVKGAVTYPQIPTVVNLDADGKFSLKLPATDDPAVSPNGFTYKVDIAVTAFVNGRAITDVESSNVSLAISDANAQGIANLSALLPAPAVGTPTIFLTRGAADARYLLKTDIPELPSNLITEDNIGEFLEPVDLTGYATTAQATSIAAAKAAQAVAGIVIPTPDLTGVVKTVNGSTPDANGSLNLTLPSPVPVIPTDVGYDLVLLLGQSNMSGRGTGTNTRQDPADSRVYQYGSAGSGNTYSSVISQAIEPLVMHDTPTGMGPGLVAARWIAQTIPVNRRILLVPAAHGGTPLSSNSGPLTWRSTVGGGLYAQALAQTNAALAAAGPNSRVIAALWLQGETDGDNSTAGTSYRTDFENLIAKLRADLNLPTLPFIIGQMVPEYLPVGTRAAINAVHAATPSRVTNTRFATSPVGQNNGDFNHFNASAQRVIGRRLFEGYLRALAGAADPALPALPAAPTVTPALTDTTAVLTWSAVTDATVYWVQYKKSSDSTFTRVDPTTALTKTITGLTAATAYDFQVIAINAAGPGTAGAISGSTTGSGGTADTTAPTAPTTVTATAGDASASIAASGATDAVGVTGYRAYTASTGGTAVASGASPLTVTGLTNGTAVTFYVSAIDAAGNESTRTASNSVTPAAGTPGGGGTAAVSDAFTRADSTTTMGNADTGQTWTPLAGTWGISTNRAYSAVSATNTSTAIESGLADCTVSVVFNQLGGTSAMTRLIFRATDASNHWLVQYRASTGVYQLYRNSGGTFTQVGSDIAGVTPTNGDVISVVLSGQSITMKVNGTTVATTSHAFNVTATKHGLGVGGSTTSPRFTAFSVTA